MSENPYATAQKPFFGREAELETLLRELQRPISGLAAVMAGRGMGKTSLARELARRLIASDGCTVHRWAQTPTSRDEFLLKLGRSLSYEFTGKLFGDELAEAIERQPHPRTVLLVDEVENGLHESAVRSLFERMRIAWEELEGRLGIVLLGGSRIYELLETESSPFLRSATFVPLTGLSREETGRLVREPAGLDVTEEEIELLWQETAGHPALLTEIMKTFVDRGADARRGILSVADRWFAQQLESKFFAIWWRNLQTNGQAIYRRLVEHGRPVPEASISHWMGRPARQWVRVLETTGVASVSEGEVLPRGELFARWARQEHFHPNEPAVVVPEHIRALAASTTTFEHELLVEIERWGRNVVEQGGTTLKQSGTARGNDRFAGEEYFMWLLQGALRQSQPTWVVEADTSSGSGRCDLKVRDPRNPAARACIELKIWGRNNYRDVVEQVLKYVVPSDAAAYVVMLDRCARPLLEEYRERLILERKHSIVGEAADRMLMPQLVTAHPRGAAAPLRIHHFLLQFPSD